MHPTLLVLFNALPVLLAGASAQTLHMVEVGRRGDSLALRFTPEEIYADVGDFVQFQFYPVVGFLRNSLLQLADIA
jgi:plastocyanin